jgi:phosphatidylinositol alpha-1,6-mannosyltransferase
MNRMKKCGERRILYLTTGCFDKGGVSRYSRYQVQALRELFGDNSVRTMSLLGPKDGDFETPFTVDWYGRGSDVIGKSIFAAECMRNALVDRPMIIHAAHLNLAPLAKAAANLIGAATILNIYGREVWSWMSWSRKRAMRTMDCVIADCHFTSNYVAEHQMRVSRPVVVWDCVDLDRFSPGICRSNVLEHYGIPSSGEPFIIMTLGRLSRSAQHKGFERLLRVFAEIAPSCPRATLVIAGSGNLSDHLMRLARELHIDGKTCFTGSIDERHLPDIYRAASIFSLVSDRGEGRGEGIPLSPLEALACGIPIIVGNQDGSQEAVIGGLNGIICDPFDLWAQAKTLRDLYERPTLLESMRQKARQAALENFGYDQFRNQFGDVYKRLGFLAQS